MMKGNFRRLDIKKLEIKDTTPPYRVLYKYYECSKKDSSKLICSSNVIHADKDELDNCKGLIDFIICGPREMFNNFYKYPLDKLKKYL
jgi:hypothetical protein